MGAWLAVAALALPPKESVSVATDDGAAVVVHRYARAGATPVVLCHGISSNHRFWDLDEAHSLAQTLWNTGFDVWNLDLRGHGDAQRDAEGKRQRHGWTVDDYGTHDLPAVFTHVREATGNERLHFVGHSMGGMVLAVYLATEPEPPLASAVVVGSPLDFRDPDLLVKWMLGGAPAASHTGSLPTPLGARGLALLGRQSPLQTDALLHNPDNVSPKVERMMLRRVVSPLTSGEMRQLGQARRDGEFRSADGQTVYRRELGDVDVPMLFIAGRADRIVSPDRVYSYFQAVGSPQKEFKVASRANGLHADYGHLDLGLGEHASQDVFPWITGFLMRYRGP